LNAIETNKQRPLWAENESKSEALNEKNKWDITKEINSKLPYPINCFYGPLLQIVSRKWIQNTFFKSSNKQRKARKII